MSMDQRAVIAAGSVVQRSDWARATRWLCLMTERWSFVGLRTTTSSTPSQRVRHLIQLRGLKPFLIHLVMSL